MKIPLSPWLLAALAILAIAFLGTLSTQAERAGSAQREVSKPSSAVDVPHPSDREKARCPAGTLEDNGVCIPVTPLPIEALPAKNTAAESR